VSISSTFYKQILLVQISKGQKNIQDVSLFSLLGSVSAKAGRRTLMKLTPGESPLGTRLKSTDRDKLRHMNRVKN